MKLVLDGVFNHTGDSHPWFDRYQQAEGGRAIIPIPRIVAGSTSTRTVTC